MKRRHPDSNLRLRAAYERHYDKTELNSRTIEKHRHTLTFWERCTDNLPVGRITNATVEAFKAEALKRVCGNSVNGHWSTIRAILRRLGPQETGNPGGLGIIAGPVPYMKRCRVVLGPPKRVPLDDLTRAYVAAKHAQYPRAGVQPADWWRALIVVAFFTGLRKSDLLSLEWSQIDLDAATLDFTAQKTGKSDRFPLHPVAVAHLERIIRPSGRVFGGLYWRGTRFYKVWHDILDRAKCSAPFGLHDIRKTAASEIERARPGMAPFLLQHAGRSVTARYLNLTEELREAVEASHSSPGICAAAFAKPSTCSPIVSKTSTCSGSSPCAIDWILLKLAAICRNFASSRWRCSTALGLRMPPPPPGSFRRSA